MRFINRFFLLFILLCPLLGCTQVWQTKPLDNMLLAQGKSDVRAANNNQEKRPQQEIKKLLILAEEQLSRMQLRAPIGNNAYETYQQVLKIDPNNDEAKRGIVRIGDKYQELAKKYATSGSLQMSLSFIKIGLEVVPDHSGLLAQQAVIEEALLTQAKTGRRVGKAQNRVAEDLPFKMMEQMFKGTPFSDNMTWSRDRAGSRDRDGADGGARRSARDRDGADGRARVRAGDRDGAGGGARRSARDRDGADGRDGAGGRDRAIRSHTVVRIFYATDRNRTSEVKPAEMFGNDRGTLSFGYCDVSIPRGHRIGELESPSVWRLEFDEDPDKHVVLFNTVIRSKDEFFEDLRARVRDSVKSSAFLFVHGYNVKFEDAARRTAQISYDLSFDGAPIFYSWPSQGITPAYTVDEQNIEWAQANLKNFLEDFFERSDAQNVYLIAHSMGNRALTRAVASLLTDKPIIRGRLKEVILAAPDIDAEVFKRDIVPALTKTDSPVTLYASSEDLALAASKQVHGYPRAGDSGQGLVVVSGIETIDATHVDTGLLGHSYFAETRSIIDDMYYLIRHSHRADQRFGLRRVDAKVGRYWEFKK